MFIDVTLQCKKKKYVHIVAIYRPQAFKNWRHVQLTNLMCKHLKTTRLRNNTLVRLQRTQVIEIC